METAILLVQYMCVLLAALVLGNWYLSECKRLKAAGAPWYASYLTPPGIIIITILLLLPLLGLIL
jgi:hypothetical protein